MGCCFLVYYPGDSACRMCVSQKSDEQVAEEGLSCMESWMKELGFAMNLRELDVTEEILDGIADGTIIMEGGYKILDRDEVMEILKAS